MGSSRAVVMVVSLGLACALSCKRSESATSLDESTRVDAREPSSDVGSDRPAPSAGGDNRPDAAVGGSDADASPEAPAGTGGMAGVPAGTGGMAGVPTGTGGMAGVPTGTGGTAGVPTGTGAAGAPGRPPPVTRRVAVFGDYGGDTAEEAAVAALVTSWNPDAVITVGDNNYIAGTFDGYDQNVGKDYHAFIGSYRGKFGAGAATNRFWPALGDHDWALGVASYVDYFTLPGNERYYDVDLGPVHLYAINSNAEEPDGYQPTGTQGTWLKDRLASSTSCFDLVYFHHPPYSSGYHGSRTYMDWPFAAWGAEATFAGHDHNYERLEVSGIP